MQNPLESLSQSLMLVRAELTTAGLWARRDAIHLLERFEETLGHVDALVVVLLEHEKAEQEKELLLNREKEDPA